MTFINFENKINVFNPTYTAKLDLKLKKTNISTQKIDNLFDKFLV